MRLSFKYQFFSVVLLFLWSTQLCFSQTEVEYTKADSLIFETYTKKFSQHADMPVGALLLKTATYFSGIPYVASTLEKPANETLLVNLREFDCTTFVESCMALTLTIKSKQNTFADFCAILKRIRYRNEKVDGYASRLHYVSDWIYEHQKDNMLANVSKNMQAVLVPKTINFMSKHPMAYRQISTDTNVLGEIKKVEDRLNKRLEYYVIAKDKISNVESAMKNGDIVVFATSIAGLDFSHIGIITTADNKTTFVHASSRAGKIIIEPKSLAEYCKASKACTGITVLRLNENIYNE